MMGLEALLYKLVGGNDALIMLGAFIILIFLNFITEMWWEIKNNDLRWNDISRFALPILPNAMFLLGLEVTMIPASRIPLVYDIFATVQMAGWVGVMAVYFYGFYKNLKKLGLQTGKRLDDILENIRQEDTMQSLEIKDNKDETASMKMMKMRGMLDGTEPND